METLPLHYNQAGKEKSDVDEGIAASTKTSAGGEAREVGRSGSGDFGRGGPGGYRSRICAGEGLGAEPSGNAVRSVGPSEGWPAIMNLLVKAMVWAGKLAIEELKKLFGASWISEAA